MPTAQSRQITPDLFTKLLKQDKTARIIASFMDKLQKNYLITSFCRQCHAAVPTSASTCPVCGIARPNYEKLNSLEKQYLENPPMVPGKFHNMLDTVDPKHNLASNMVKEFSNYMTDFMQSWPFFLAFIATVAGGTMLMANVLFPLSFMLFWASLVYLGYDAINFSRAILTSFLVKRLQLKTGMSPYSVHFKIEAQLEKMLESLALLINSFFDHDWQNTDNSGSASSESFLSAVETILKRIQRYAKLSLNTTEIIWKNNVYAIVAMNTSSQDKVSAIGNKIKEAEAMLIRYRWLKNLGKISTLLKNFVAGERDPDAPDNASYRQYILNSFYLDEYGPLKEKCENNFEQVPYEVPFKMRIFWHQQLPPFPLESDKLLEEFPETNDFFESIDQVKKLKAALEEQMVLDYASNAVSEISDLEKAEKTDLEAKDLKNYELYSKYLEIPGFKPDEEELQKKVDRLRAEVRVAIGSDHD
jgi:ribosomal protein L40E